MARVTLAEDTLLGRKVALKRVYASGDPTGMARLKREALLGASLNHPNLVAVYDAQIREDGDVVLVMEYVPGETLRDVISARGALAPEEAMPVLRGVAAALDAIHARGIVHRDVKPANVLLGEEGAVKLADLGVAEAIDQTRVTTPDAVAGSFSYMSPEQLSGKSPSPSMDIYALAAVAYEALSGKRARPESNPLALAHAIATQPPPDLRKARPQTPAAAAEVLKRGMSRDPGRRPGSAGELVRRLGATFEAEQPTRAVAAAAAPKTRPRTPAPVAARRRRSPVLAPALVLLAAALTAGVVVAALAAGGGKRSVASASGTHASVQAARAHRRSHAAGATHKRAHPPRTSTPRTSATASSPVSAPPATAPAPAPPSASSPSATAGSPRGSAAGAVESFYEAAAQHLYGAAWALADPNMRSEVGGYPSFQNEMSSVRSIMFHRAEVVGSPGPDSAIVALETTSVQTDRTQQCSGTARTVRSGSVWLLDGISISCT